MKKRIPVLLFNKNDHCLLLEFFLCTSFGVLEFSILFWFARQIYEELRGSVSELFALPFLCKVSDFYQAEHFNGRLDERMAIEDEYNVSGKIDI